MNIIEQIFFPDIGYPKEYGEHRWIAHSKEDAIRWVQNNNGFTSCYGSIYSFGQFNQLTGRPIYDSANVSHIYLDLDGEHCKEDMIKIHQYLLKEDIKHWLMFSGGGYHIYIFCIPISNLIVDFSVSEALASYQNHLGELLDIEICSSCRGNLSKVSRIPNTWHIKQKRFSIPITDPYVDHPKLANVPNWNIKIFGTKLIDLSIWKSKPISDPIDIPLIDIEGISFPPCILKIVKNTNPVYEERMALTAYLNEMFRLGADQIDIENVNRIINQIVDFLETLKWKKFSRTKSKKYVKYLVKGLSKSFSHQKIRNMGLCEHCGEN